MKLKSLSCVRLFVTPWTLAHQASLSMGFCRQECWSGLPFLQGIFPTQGSNPSLRHCRRTLYQLSHQGRYVVVLFIFTPDNHSLYFLFFLMSLTRKFSFNNLFKEVIFFSCFFDCLFYFIDFCPFFPHCLPAPILLFYEKEA